MRIFVVVDSCGLASESTSAYTTWWYTLDGTKLTTSTEHFYNPSKQNKSWIFSTRLKSKSIPKSKAIGGDILFLPHFWTNNHRGNCLSWWLVAVPLLAVYDHFPLFIILKASGKKWRRKRRKGKENQTIIYPLSLSIPAHSPVYFLSYPNRQSFFFFALYDPLSNWNRGFNLHHESFLFFFFCVKPPVS